MKKIFTLLFCVAAMAFAAQADDNLIDQCINYVLYNGGTTTIRATSLDANNDQVVNISDVIVLINQSTNQGQINQAPAEPQSDAIINSLLTEPKPVVTIKDATDAINKEIKDE